MWLGSGGVLGQMLILICDSACIYNCLGDQMGGIIGIIFLPGTQE